MSSATSEWVIVEAVHDDVVVLTWSWPFWNPKRLRDTLPGEGGVKYTVLGYDGPFIGDGRKVYRVRVKPKDADD